MSRNITARELKDLEGFWRIRGDEKAAKDYKREEEELQKEMNRD